MSEAEINVFPPAMPRETLPPDMYSGAYLLGLHYSLARTNFVPTPDTKTLRLKIYTYRGHFFVVPFGRSAPPAGFDWQEIGRKQGRALYMATKREIACLATV